MTNQFTTPASSAMTKRHELKTDPEVFAAVMAGRKTHEIRLNDRGFTVGDELLLRETANSGAEMKAGAPLAYTGREATRTVSHIQTGYGLANGWCILSFASQPVAAAPLTPEFFDVPLMSVHLEHLRHCAASDLESGKAAFLGYLVGEFHRAERAVIQETAAPEASTASIERAINVLDSYPGAWSRQPIKILRAALQQRRAPAMSGEQVFELAAPYFAWNAPTWHRATEGRIGMPYLLEYTKAAVAKFQQAEAAPVASAEPLAYAVRERGKIVKLTTEKKAADDFAAQAHAVGEASTVIPLTAPVAQAAPAPADEVRTFATFEDWLASDIEPPPANLTPQQMQIAYAKLAFNAGRAAPAPVAAVPVATDEEIMDKYSQIVAYPERLTSGDYATAIKLVRHFAAPVASQPAQSEQQYDK